MTEADRLGARGGARCADPRKCLHARPLAPVGPRPCLCRDKLSRGLRLPLPRFRGDRFAGTGFCPCARRRDEYQAQNEGHLVDALALRGDEGRGTLRKARGRCERSAIPGSPNGATHPARGITI